MRDFLLTTTCAVISTLCVGIVIPLGWVCRAVTRFHSAALRALERRMSVQLQLDAAEIRAIYKRRDEWLAKLEEDA